MYKQVLGAIFLLILNTTHASQVIQLAEVEHVINEALQQFNIPGIAVGIVADNKVILSKGYGMRDVKKNYPPQNRPSSL